MNKRIRIFSLSKFLFVLVFFLAICFYLKGGSSFASIIYYPEYPVYATQEKAIIMYDAETSKETLIITPFFQGSAKNFGLLIPVPSIPEVTTLKSDLFSEIEAITQPYYGNYYPSALKSFSGISNPLAPETDVRTQNVNVWNTQSIDVYDIAILSTTDANDLDKWLKDNKFKVPVAADFVIKDYVPRLVG